MLEAETATLDTVGPIGPHTLELRFAVDTANRPIYEDAIVRSLAQARSQLATELFDDLLADADAWQPHAEQVVAWARRGADRGRAVRHRRAPRSATHAVKPR